MSDLVDRFDDFQRRHPVVGFPLGVVYKFFDDQGAYLAAIITYYSFVAIFPLLLIASSVLGFLLQGNPEVEEAVLDSALRTFPIVGTQLGRPEGLQGSTGAVDRFVESVRRGPPGARVDSLERAPLAVSDPLDHPFAIRR